MKFSTSSISGKKTDKLFNEIIIEIHLNMFKRYFGHVMPIQWQTYIHKRVCTYFFLFF